MFSSILSFVAVLVFSVKADVSDLQYALMPELFYHDNYDQCLLRGKEALYCTFTYQLKPLGNSDNISVWQIVQNISSNPQNYRHDKLRHAICVSDTCGRDFKIHASVRDDIETCYNKKYKDLGLEGAVSNLTCQGIESSYSIDACDIAYGISVLLYVLFVAFASIYERCFMVDDKLRFYEKSTAATRCIAAFSVPRNWTRLRTINSNPDHRKLRSIQGMRFYNMICVIMSHTVMRILGGPVANPQFTENSTKHVLKMFIANGWYAVQTFFVISGWLLSYHLFDMTENKQFKPKFIFWGILNRYIRLFPALAFTVGFHATWLVHLSNGPNWDMFIGEEYRNCRKNWWTNILFVNNYVDNNNMCLHQTWYIASDMQLFVYSIILLYFISKYPAKLKHIFGISLVVGLITPGVLAYVNNYDIIIREYPEILYNLNLLRLNHWHALFSSAYSNIFGYTIGLVFGYLFFRCRNTCLKIRRIHVVLWWLLSFGMCLSVVLIAVVFYNPAFVVTPFKSALYWSCGKNLFALGVAIGLFGFTQKIGWFARWVCEFRPVQVLGRLTYSTYLVHTAVVRWQMGFNRYPFPANDSIIFAAVLGDVTLSYLAGALLCLLVEMPVSALQKILGSNSQRKRNAVNKSSEKSLETLDLANDKP